MDMDRLNRSNAMLAVLCISLAACPHPRQPGGLDDLIDRAEVEAVAARIYASATTPDELRASVSEVFDALGVPTLAPDTTAQEMNARLAAGRVFLPAATLDVITKGFQDNLAVDLESFFQALARIGIQSRESTGAITVASLTPRFAALASQGQVRRRELLPALVSALGRARAKKNGIKQPNAAWGDGKLDPLQFTLLYFGIFSLPSQGQPASHSATQALTDSLHMRDTASEAAAEGGLGHAGGEVVLELLIDFLGKLIKVPLGVTQTVPATVCASIYIFSLKVDLSVNPGTIWHQEADNPSRPYQSDMVAKLSFNFVPNTDPYLDKVREIAGCKDLPKNGPVPDDTKVEWKISPELEDHGSFYVASNLTGSGLGRVEAKFRAILDPLPKPFRLDSKIQYQFGWITVIPEGLYPEFENLEQFVRAVNPTLMEQQRKDLTVFWYGDPKLNLSADLKISATNLWYAGDASVTTFHSEMPLTFVHDPNSDPHIYAKNDGAPFSYKQSYTPGPYSCSYLQSYGPSALPIWQAFRGAAIMSGTVDTMPVLFTPANVDETWFVGQKSSKGQCSGQIDAAPGSVGMSAWMAMHNGELSLSPVISDFKGAYVIKDWLQDTDHSVKKEYHGSFTHYTEDTVLRITATE
jgi:hypothetical protein